MLTMRNWSSFWGASLSHRHFLRNKLKTSPYRVQIEQQLSRTDNGNHLAFAQRCKENLEKIPSFMERIVFSDECTFSLQSAVNKENYRIWGLQRPKTVSESLQSSPKLLVRYANFRTEVVGSPFFDDGTVTGNKHKRMQP